MSQAGSYGLDALGHLLLITVLSPPYICGHAGVMFVESNSRSLGFLSSWVALPSTEGGHDQVRFVSLYVGM